MKADKPLHGSVSMILLALVGLLFVGYMFMNVQDSSKGTSSANESEQVRSPGFDSLDDRSYGVTGVIINAEVIAQFAFKEEKGSYEGLCIDGKLNVEHPDIREIVYRWLDASGNPYILYEESDLRCFASRNSYAVSGSVTSDGVDTAICFDSNSDEISGVGTIADSTTESCVVF